MFEVSVKPAQARQCTAQHHADLALTFADNNSCPAPYLTGVGQVLRTKSSALSSHLTLSQAQGFITDITPLLIALDAHCDNQFVAKFLTLTPHKLLANRYLLLQQILSVVSDISALQTKHTVLKNVADHQSLFSLDIINLDDHFTLNVMCDEPFYLYNLDEANFPAFLHDWLECYIVLLADKIGIETVTQDLINYELEHEIDCLEIDVESYNAQDIVVFKKHIERHTLNEHEKTRINALQTQVAQGCYYDDESAIDIALEVIVRWHDAKSIKTVPKMTLNGLNTEFATIITQHRATTTQHDQVTIDLIQSQLDVLADIDIDTPLQHALLDDGDVPIALAAIFDTHRKINHSGVDINNIGEHRYGYGECARLSVDLSVSDALPALHRMIICEYFAQQLCFMQPLNSSQEHSCI